MLNESHSVETPEQTNIEFTVAGVGSRSLALAIDSLIQACAIFVLLLVGGIWLAARVFGGIWLTAALVIAGFLLYYGYFALFEIFWNGQTPGKRQIGIRVIKDTGRRLTPLETIARNLLRIIDQIPGFYAVGMVVSLLNKQNKRIGDLVTGALVIREGSKSELNPAWYLHTPTRETLAPMGANLLTDDDVILIESFLQRRYELDPAIRYRMASQIFSRIEHKLTISPEDRGGVEHLLEAAVQERRDGNYGAVSNRN
jgi:uncharacterized RDD family membrane protein YckC